MVEDPTSDTDVVAPTWCSTEWSSSSRFSNTSRTTSRSTQPRHRDGVQVGCCQFPDAVIVFRRPLCRSEIVVVIDDLDGEYVAVRAVRYQLADDLTRRPWGYQASGSSVRLVSIYG